MPKFMIAAAGTNPMEMPEIIKKQRMGKLQTWGIIGGAILFLVLLCGVPVFLLTRPKAAPAQAASMTATPTATLTSTPTATTTGTQYPTSTPTITQTGTHAPTATSAATQTPWILTQVVTRVVNQNVPYPVVTVMVATVQIPVQQTVIVTNTPEPTQTPWIVTVEVTRIVEVTPTETPTPEPTATPTETSVP